MSHHILQGRTEAEVLWYRRRSFLQAAAAWTAMGGYGAARAAQRSNVVELAGDAFVNGQKLLQDQYIQTGDQIETGPDSHLVFVMGNSAFLVRQNSRMTVERGDTLNAVSVLRLVTGAIVSVWSKGNSRQITTPTLTAGIRGTGVYTELAPDGRTYFCNCYGTVELATLTDRALSRSVYHQSFWADPQPRAGRQLSAAPAINHTDEELERLAALIDQRTAWQELGRKGVKDGAGFMDPGRAHPLAR